jgi:hypothetical protein
MKVDHGRSASLPLRGSLALVTAFSVIMAILMAGAAGAGLLLQRTIYPSDDLHQAFVPTDVSILFIGLPMLLVSMWLARRGKLIGLLLWPGALFFTFYNYLIYVLAMPLSVAFLLHLALVAFSTYTLIALLASIDAQAVQEALAGAVPERLAGGILAGLGLVFFLRALGVMIGALAGQAPITAAELALNSSDTLISPASVVGGVLLWRRKAFGYVTGVGLLFQASMLFIGLIILLLLQPLIVDAPFALVDVLVVFAMGLICFVPFALYVRGAVAGRRA